MSLPRTGAYIPPLKGNIPFSGAVNRFSPFLVLILPANGTVTAAPSAARSISWPKWLARAPTNQLIVAQYWEAGRIEPAFKTSSFIGFWVFEGERSWILLYFLNRAQVCSSLWRDLSSRPLLRPVPRAATGPYNKRKIIPNWLKTEWKQMFQDKAGTLILLYLAVLDEEAAILH